MQQTLYVAPGSAPCRSVLLLLRQLPELAQSIEIRSVDLSAGEHLTDEFLAINPQHTVPTFVVDEGPGPVSMWQSRAIMRCLCSVTPRGAGFYPLVPMYRAQVDRLLDWDVGTFYPAVSDVVYPEVFQGTEPTERAEKKLRDVLEYLEEVQLGDEAYLLGPGPTVADITIGIGSTMVELVGRDLSGYPRIDAWRQQLERLPGWAEVNEPFEAWKASVAERQEAEDAEDPAE